MALRRIFGLTKCFIDFTRVEKGGVGLMQENLRSASATLLRFTILLTLFPCTRCNALHYPIRYVILTIFYIFSFIIYHFSLSKYIYPYVSGINCPNSLYFKI